MKQQSALPKFALDQLAREQRVADVHPDADVLTAFCEGALVGAERGRVMEHIARCGDCREVVFLSAPDTLSQPALAEEKITAGAKPIVSWWRRYMPAMATAAAIVVVGSAVLLQPNLMRSRQPVSSVPSEADADKANRGIGSNSPAREEVAPQSAPVNKVASPSKATEQLPRNKKSEGAVAGGVASAELADSRRDTSYAYTGQVQQQAVASGSHGPVEPKGNSSNYQTAALTPQVARVAPGARGGIEPKGNTYFESNAAPQVTKEQQALRAAAPPAATQPSAKDQPAVRGELSDSARSRNVALIPVAPAPAKAKTLEKQDTVASAKATTDKKNELLAYDAYKPDASDGITVGSQEPMPSVMSRVVTDPYHFRIDEDGELQRSTGKDDWKPAMAKAQAKVHVVSVMGLSVWAGGSHGRLFHSEDGGEHWTKVQLESSGKPLSDAITSIKFRDFRSGIITTDSGTVWETSDGGRHWRLKR